MEKGRSMGRRIDWRKNRTDKDSKKRDGKKEYKVAEAKYNIK